MIWIESSICFKDKHINLFPQLRMRVRLAVQVLSSSVSDAVIAHDDPNVVETANICKLFDSWSHALDGRYRSDGMKQKTRPSALWDILDPRFKWFEETFLHWLKEWEGEINDIPCFTKTERNKFFLSLQTSNGFKITTKAFTVLVQQMQSEDGVQFILPGKLN